MCFFSYRENNNEGQMEDTTYIKKPPNTFMFFLKEQRKLLSFLQNGSRAVHLGKMGRAFHFSPDQDYKMNLVNSCIRAGGCICSSLLVSLDVCTSPHLLWSLCCFPFQKQSRTVVSWRLSCRGSSSTSTVMPPANCHPIFPTTLPESQHAKLICPRCHQPNPPHDKYLVTLTCQKL